MKVLKKNGYNLCFTLIVLVLALMPVLLMNGAVKSTTVLFLGKCIAFAIVALGLDLIWGYTGILSLGHGLYFCLGAYGMGMYLKMVQTHGKITDFMQVGGLKELPMIWKPFLSLPGTFLMIFFVPLILSGLIGYFIFKNRVNYFPGIDMGCIFHLYCNVTVYEWKCRDQSDPVHSWKPERTEKSGKSDYIVLYCTCFSDWDLCIVLFPRSYEIWKAFDCDS